MEEPNEVLETEEESLGTLLAQFYMNLVEIKHEQLIGAYLCLERYLPKLSRGETWEIQDEIIRDARKKCVHVIRLPYVEMINQTITAGRKRLKLKAALDHDAAQSHNHRYLLVIMDIVGVWSNIVLELRDYGFRRDMLHSILSNLYPRIIEMVWDSFQIFKQDRDIDRLCVKSMNINEEVSLNTIDSIAQQLSTIRSVINRHYHFLFDAFTAYFFMEYNSEESLLQVSILDRMVFPSNDELLKWKEVDLLYNALENAYMLRTLADACEEVSLLEIEEGVFIIQLVEDAFFLMNKSLDRALSTSEETILFSLANKILETIYFAGHGGMLDALLYEIVANKLLFKRCFKRKFIENKSLLQQIIAKCTGKVLAVNQQLFHTPGKPSSHDNSNKSPMAVTQGHESTNNEEGLETLWKEANHWFSNWASPYIGPATTTDDSNNHPSHTATTTAGIGFQTPTVQKKSSSSNNLILHDGGGRNGLIQAKEDGRGKLKILTPPTSSGSSGSQPLQQAQQQPREQSLQDLLLQALHVEEDDDEHEDYGAKNNEQDLITAFLVQEQQQGSQHNNNNSVKLHANDQVIHLNTVAITIQALYNIQQTLIDANESPDLFLTHRTFTTQQQMHNTSLSVLIHEYQSCITLYENYLQQEINDFVSEILTQEANIKQLFDFLNLKFEISGVEMEQRSRQQQLKMLVWNILISSPIGPSLRPLLLTGNQQTENAENVDKSRLCAAMNSRFILALTRNTVQEIFEKIILARMFTEWGAILLQEEILCLSQSLEFLLPEDTIEVKKIFQQIHLACRLLNLDAPGDIKRYRLDAEVLNEQQVRMIMSRRVEFSKDAVQKVRLTFIEK